MWPGHRVTVTPDHGTVAPRSTVAVCVSAATAARSASLPWSGAINVTCDGQHKVRAGEAGIGRQCRKLARAVTGVRLRGKINVSYPQGVTLRIS
jgi:hypothetical protein